MEDILKGAYDMHIHTSPDVSPRKSTDIEIAEEWKTAGMKGGVVKCHFADTTGRAAILSALYPDLKIYGGLVLNRQMPWSAWRRQAENTSGSRRWTRWLTGNFISGMIRPRI